MITKRDLDALLEHAKQCNETVGMTLERIDPSSLSHDVVTDLENQMVQATLLTKIIKALLDVQTDIPED